MIRLLSYNIHKGIGGRDRRYRLARIIDVIDREQPDLICLQEVDRDARRSRHDDQPRLLADHFGSVGHLYQMNVHLKSGGYGNLILSRWPLRTTHQISLRLKAKKPRNAQMVVVETPHGLLHVVNTHLGLTRKERHWQVRHLLTHRRFLESAKLPTVIVGDTNDWRNTLGPGPLAEHGFAQATAPISRFRSFPAYLAIGSLDKAFYRNVQFSHARVASTRLSRRASDHLPLVVDFRLPR